jgi:hypothetical protein
MMVPPFARESLKDKTTDRRPRRCDADGLRGILSFRDEKQMKNEHGRAYNPLIYAPLQASKM